MLLYIINENYETLINEMIRKRNNRYKNIQNLIKKIWMKIK